MNKQFARVLCCTCCFSLLWSQEQSIAPVRPSGPFVVRPFKAPDVPHLRHGNSPRLRDLIHGGILYLSVQDAISLALENNLDIELARYSPLIAAWQLERFQAGGALPGVPSGASQAGSVAVGQGVSGSQAAAGVSLPSASRSAGRPSNATISQIGPVTQTLDPTFQDNTVFSHVSSPQFNTVQSLTPNLVSTTHVYSYSMQEGFLTGGSITANYIEHYDSENAPSDILNPTEAPAISVSFQQALLNGFGIAVNERNIVVQRINLGASDLNFRTQVISTVSQVLNLYYGLVSDYEDAKAKQGALDVSNRLLADAKKQVNIGTLAPLDETTAESQAAIAERDLIDSQTTLLQQEIQLKNVLSRTGGADPLLVETRIVPTDRIVVPESDDLAPVNDLVRNALAMRADLASERAGIRSSQVSALGTANGLLPTLVLFGTETQAGLSGTGHPQVINVNHQTIVETPNPFFVGGIQNGLQQVFDRNFPTENIGDYFGAAIRNRQAQADYAVDQISLRQSQLSVQKDLNQVQVDVRNYIVAMRQARSRYQAAVRNVTLQEQLYDAENKKLGLGASTPSLVIQEQRDLTSAKAAVILAEATYVDARIALDQTLGTTLEVNHVSIEEAQRGKVARRSAPVATPTQP